MLRRRNTPRPGACSVLQPARRIQQWQHCLISSAAGAEAAKSTPAVQRPNPPQSQLFSLQTHPGLPTRARVLHGGRQHGDARGAAGV